MGRRRRYIGITRQRSVAAGENREPRQKSPPAGDHLSPICGGYAGSARGPRVRPADIRSADPSGKFALLERTIVDAAQLGGVMLEKLAELFDEQLGSRTRIRSRRVA